jgi:hypothetical protein
MTTPANRCSGTGRLGEQLSLLEQAPFSPQLPKPATLAAKLLSRLLDGEELTHRKFEDATRSWRCAAYVLELRELGWPIETVELPAPSAECPSRHIALYRLPEWVRQELREAA